MSNADERELHRFECFMLIAQESDQRWAELFARPESEDLLERLADEALAAHRAGQTRPVKMEDLQ